MKKDLFTQRDLSILMVVLLAGAGCTLPDRITDSEVVSEVGGLGASCEENDHCEINLICVDGVCSLEGAKENDAGTDEKETLIDSGMIAIATDGGVFIEAPLIDSGINDIDAGGTGYSFLDSGTIVLIDAGQETEATLDSGNADVSPLRTWGESCSVNSAILCAHGLSCINGFCEEVCESLGLCENCCPLSGAPFCEQINSDLSVCKQKAGLLIELTWASENNNFDLYFSKAQYEHCHEQNSCYYKNCQLNSENPADFSGDGPLFSESDPVMVIADTCGYGPETIHLGGASFGNYQVGVHLNNNDVICLINEEQSPATATVTIYLDNTFHSEYSSTFAVNGDFWELGYLDWINNDLQVMAFNGYESNWMCGGGPQP